MTDPGAGRSPGGGATSSSLGGGRGAKDERPGAKLAWRAGRSRRGGLARAARGHTVGRRRSWRAAHELPRPVARYWAWADLMQRAFDIDVLACPRYGGRLRSIATVEDADAIRAILGSPVASEEFVGRAPPPVAALETSHVAATGV
jgi:hypothetical protein